MKETNTTVEKTMRLINYIKRTKKADTCDFLINKKPDKYWLFYFDLGGFYNGSYFAIQITHSKIWNQDNIQIVNTTDNICEIKNLLEQYGLYD